MHQWFRKGDARRFHRVDMKLQSFIIPSSPLEDREIYASGVNYFPNVVTSKLEALKFATLNSLDRIQDQKTTISGIVNEVIQDIEFFGNCLKDISEGRHPKQDMHYWMQIKEKLSGFEEIKLLLKSSPKTYQYFKLIEDKYLKLLNHLVNTINLSSADDFVVEGRLPVGFKLDEMVKKFQHPQFSKIPLIQTILHLAELLDAYIEVYRQINDDNYLKYFPNEWPLRKVNISASGIAIQTPKRLPLYSHVNVYLYFESSAKTIEFEGSVVDIREMEAEKLERIAINFEFPNGNDQNFLQQEIQKQEVKECMKYSFY